MARKKKHEEEHENHERWLVSYADFITLLFAFFVVMYAVSRVDNKRLVEVANSIRWALHFEGTGGAGALPIFEGPPSEGGCVVNIGTGGRGSQPDSPIQAVHAVRKKIEKKLRPFLLDRNNSAVTIENDGRRLLLRLAVASFFDPAQAALRPEALPLLDAVAEELVTLGRPIRVEGHTDNSAVEGKTWRNNWDLSAARAATVVTYLERVHHVRPDRLAAVGMGSARPIADNASPAGRLANRRVELVVELPGETVEGVRAMASQAPASGG